MQGRKEGITKEELICKRTYVKKKILNIVNNMLQLHEQEAGLKKRNENLIEEYVILDPSLWN